MAPKRTPNVHGSKGAYVGGDWVPLDRCDKEFAIEDGSGSRCAPGPCPRSRTRHTAAHADGSYDVVVVGAGCVGSAVARELSKYELSVLLLEAADDVSQGATKGNSGIVHAGYDDKPGSVLARLCWKGNQMFPELDRDLHFGYQRNGSLVLARSAEDEAMLDELYQRGQTNGVKDLKILSQEEVRSMEPAAALDVTKALHAPHAGTVAPYEFAIALAENAADNGVEVRIRREVRGIERDGEFLCLDVEHWEPRPSGVDALKSAAGVAGAVVAAGAAVAAQAGNHTAALVGAACSAGVVATALLQGRKPALQIQPEHMVCGGTGHKAATNGTCVEREKIRTRFIVNAAGGGADKIAAMLGDTSFQILPRLGEYILLEKQEGWRAGCTLFPAPGKMGKGVLVQATIWGNLILGPTARDVTPDMKKPTKEELMEGIFKKCRELVPDFDAKQVIHTFNGARAKSTRGDWIIERSGAEGRLIHAAGIDSPGLAGSPAIALEVVELLRQAGLGLKPDPSFNPRRAPLIKVKDGWRDLKCGPEGKVTDPQKNVVCKCEKVVEAEIVDALRRSLPIDNTQAIRRRTRAGMGHCQADKENYDCESRVAKIIARETGRAVGSVGRRPWPGTSFLPSRWLTDASKATIDRLSR